MLKEEIYKLREKLNKSIENGEKYQIIYNISIELDELIVKYYNEMQKNNKVVCANLNSPKQ